MNHIWDRFFPDQVKYQILLNTGDLATVGNGNYLLAFIKSINMNQSSILITNLDGNLLITDSYFENSFSKTNGVILFNTNIGKSEFVMNRCCSYRCGCIDNSYHFLMTKLNKSINNRNWIIDTSISWCGHTESNGQCIRDQSYGEVVNININDSYCSLRRHAGPSLESSIGSYCAFLTVAYNNCSEGCFYNVRNSSSTARNCIFVHNVDKQRLFGLFILQLNSSCTATNCIIAYNDCNLIYTTTNAILTLSNCAFSNNKNMDISKAVILGTDKFETERMRMNHYANGKCVAENPMIISKRCKTYLNYLALILQCLTTGKLKFLWYRFFKLSS